MNDDQVIIISMPNATDDNVKNLVTAIAGKHEFPVYVTKTKFELIDKQTILDMHETLDLLLKQNGWKK